MVIERLMSVKEAAERLGISPQVLYALVAARKIACRRAGIARGRIRFTESDLEEWLAAQRVPPEAPRPQWDPQAQRDAERAALGLPPGRGMFDR